MHGHVLVRHIRRQFILQTVNVDKNTVQFFFVLFELLKALFALGLPSSIFLGNQSSHCLFLRFQTLRQDITERHIIIHRGNRGIDQRVAVGVAPVQPQTVFQSHAADQLTDAAPVALRRYHIETPQENDS